MVSTPQHLENRRVRLARIFRKPAVGASLCFVLAVTIHVPFGVFQGFGEQDAARIAGSAAYGSIVNSLHISNQSAFSCPLYIHFLYTWLTLGLGAPSELPFLMTSLSIVFSALCTAFLFIFLERMTGSLAFAYISAALLQLAPVFFFNSIYGFPTICALAFLIASAIVFDLALSSSKKAQAVSLIALFLVLYICAVCIKVDAIMASALFCLPVHLRSKSVRRTAICILGLMVLAGIVFYLFNQYGLSLSKQKTVVENWKSWSSRFYGGLDTLLTFANVKVVAKSSGLITVPVALIGCAIMLFFRTHRKVVLWILLTAVPIMIYWACIKGNSARHNLIPAVFFCVPAALPFALTPRWIKTFWAGVVILAAIFNYIWLPPGANPNNPSGNLIASADMMKKSVHKYTKKARRMVRNPAPKTVIIGPNHKHPYYYFELLCSKRLIFKKKAKNNIIMLDKTTKREKIFYFPTSSKEKKWATKKGYATVYI